MNLCSDDHGEVCYEGRQCPACDVIEDKNKEIEALTETLKEKDEAISDLNGEVASLQRELEAAQAEPEKPPTFWQNVRRTFHLED